MAFFGAQRDFIVAQSQHLHVQLRQLRLRTVADGIRLVLQAITLGVVLTLLLIFVGIVRNAMDDHGLIIEAFSSPPDLTDRGLSGQGLAEAVLAELGSIRRTARGPTTPMPTRLWPMRSHVMAIGARPLRTMIGRCV